MMRNRSWDDWIARYQTSHQNRWNQLTHTFGIPMIVAALALAPLALIFPALWPWAAVLFVAGWVLQFIGHASAGKPPEFLSDWRFLRRHALVVEEGHRAGMSGGAQDFSYEKSWAFAVSRRCGCGRSTGQRGCPRPPRHPKARGSSGP